MSNSDRCDGTPARIFAPGHGVRVLLMRLCLTILLGLMLAPGCSTPPKHYRVGILSGLDFFAATAEGFREQMANLGYGEGKNITYILHRTNFEPIREQQILEAFVNDSVDLIFAFPTEVSVLARQLSDRSGIPLVFANANVEGVDLVKNMRDPGGYTTGVRFPGPDIAVRRLEVLHELAPRAKQVLVPFQRDYPIVGSQLGALEPAAKSMGITLNLMPVEREDKLDSLLNVQLRHGRKVDAVLMIPEPLAVSPAGFRALARFAAAKKIPIGGATAASNGYSSLFSVSTDNKAVGKQAAALADKIFKGTPAGSIPVVSAEAFLQVNIPAARAMGVTVPPALLKQVDEVIK